MTVLENSQRRLYKATYAPVTLGVSRAESGKTTRGLDKVAYLRALAARKAEIARLREELRKTEGTPQHSLFVDALAVLDLMIDDRSPGATIHLAPRIASIGAEVLAELGRRLANGRSDAVRHLEETVTELRTRYHTADVRRADTTSQPFGDFSAGVPGTGSAATMERSTVKSPDGRTIQVTHRRHAPVPESDSTQVQRVFIAVESEPAAQPSLAGLGGTLISAPASVDDIVRWASTHEPALFHDLCSTAMMFAHIPFSHGKTPENLALNQLIAKLTELPKLTRAVVYAFEERMKIEPVGRLHLERLEMTPAGVERGELVHSVPLTPKETVSISHREWSVHREEFDKIVEDYFEGYSEEGVAEKNDVAQSTDSQSRHATVLNIGAAVTASSPSITMSTSLGYNATSDDARSQKDSRNHGISLTRKASARVKKDHKMSFKVSSVVGSEDQSVRVLTNPTDKPIRVDYYQLIRKWRVDLFRYDLRMTYDIAIPSPGIDLAKKYQDLQGLNALIDAPFEFDLKPADITANNWSTHAATYQASVQPPPTPTTWLLTHKEIAPLTESQATSATFDVMEFLVDDHYVVKSAKFEAGLSSWASIVNDNKYIFDVIFDNSGPAAPGSIYYQASLAQLIGKSGRLFVSYQYRGVRIGTLSVTLELQLRSDVFDEWRFKAWGAMRAAAEEQYLQSRQQTKDRRDRLAAEIGQFDALTLRRMEREEVMKGVLRWIFGPDFDLVPTDVAAIFGKMNAGALAAWDALDPTTLTNKEWRRMMEFGEFIKYIHQAIEWENMIFFAYPYFWGAPDGWELKRFLDHPDPLHRMFLRAGAARVVLTIRPGFEESFTALVETGAFASLPGSHPYVTIAKEIQNYADTNYPGIPPANPANPPSDEEVSAKERGVLIARWYEYTPTSALDVAIDTPAADIA